MSLPLSPEEIKSMRRLICPKCGGCAFYHGPRGGDAVNMLCDGCHREYNVGPASIELLADPCPADRRREVYGAYGPARPQRLPEGTGSAARRKKEQQLEFGQAGAEAKKARRSDGGPDSKTGSKLSVDNRPRNNATPLADYRNEKGDAV